jgi:hypothetical protein
LVKQRLGWLPREIIENDRNNHCSLVHQAPLWMIGRPVLDTDRRRQNQRPQARQ